MAIEVQAIGLVTDGPSEVSTEAGVLVVFVFDPFPEPAPANTAHGCEVRCRDSQLAAAVLQQGVEGAPVAVGGELTMSVTSGPVEDELCAVQVGIEADWVRFELSEPPA